MRKTFETEREQKLKEFEKKYFDYFCVNLDTHTSVIVDKTTNVMYMQRMNFGDGISVTPILESDGTPKLYDGELKGYGY